MQGSPPLLLFDDERIASQVLEILHYWPHEEDNFYVSDHVQNVPLFVKIIDAYSNDLISEYFRTHSGFIFLYTKQRRTSTVCDHRFYTNAPYGIFIDQLQFKLSETDRVRLASLLRPFTRRVSDMAAAIDRSMETFDMEQSKKRPLPPHWEAELSNAEPALPNDDTCAICYENKATICLVECNTTAMCDTCVRAWGEQAALQRKCPFCRTPIENVKRRKV